jgi:hypothetical protein
MLYISPVILQRLQYLDDIASNGGMVDELRIVNDLEGSGRDPIEVLS